jgi:hypothetical protein
VLGVLVLGVLGVLDLPAAPAAHAEPQRWEVTVAVHLKGGTRRPVTLRVALPFASDLRRVSDVQVMPRGLTATRVEDGEAPHVIFKGTVRRSRRVAVTYVVESERRPGAAPHVAPVLDPAPDVVPYLMPAPLFQSRSILVREFLETHVGPQVGADASRLFRAIFTATRAELTWSRDGRSLALDVIRRRQGKRIGIERALVTFLRCARVPTRFVEGVNLRSATKRKRVFWSEIWADGEWWPVSASRGWAGKLPQWYVGLARDGERVVVVDGPATASYVVNAHPVEDDGEGGA